MLATSSADKILEVRHEAPGSGMADGWARVTAHPGVATTTWRRSQPTALLTSRAASLPVTFWRRIPQDGEYPTYGPGGVRRRLRDRLHRIRVARGGGRLVRKAFYRAKLESPIMLSAPMDVQQKTFEDDENHTNRPPGLPKRVVHPDPRDWCSRYYRRIKHPVVLVGRGAKWRAQPTS
jgi:thiamine pyrophosphate-dependent acetolactate synthase large subunit-like protein